MNAPAPTGARPRVGRAAVAGLAALAVLLVAIALLPTPSAAALRGWLAPAGPVAPALALLGYAAVVTTPFPRTLLTAAAGVLFGVPAGLLIALGGAATGGLAAFVVVRRLGRDAVAARLARHRSGRSAGRALAVADARLGDRGLLAVTSLRLLPVVPFAPLSYACGLSSVRPLVFLAGTVLGSAPATVALVVLADRAGHPGGTGQLVVFGLTAAAGLAGAGLVLRRPRAAAPPPDPSSRAQVSDTSS